MLKLLLGAIAIVGLNGVEWDDELTTEDIVGADTNVLFENWMNEFGRSYEDISERATRYQIFLQNLEGIGSYNSAGLTFKLRLNQFADMTSDEFRLSVHGTDGRCFRKSEINIDLNAPSQIFESSESVNAPASVAWQNDGVVTPVKNQEQCGSCWAFSTTGALECDYAINTGTLTSLSEQQLVDCAGFKYGCYGCNGGEMTGAMTYAKNEGGLCTESAYPYTASDGSCKATTCGTKYNGNSGYTSVKSDSESSLVTAAAMGCVSVAIEADQFAFQYYSSGVLTGTCGTSLDHGVLVTGYGSTSGGTDYWWVKNSWGTSWGESGYVEICRNCNKNSGAGECGILMEPIYADFA